jgi:UDP-N-acetylglucosamine acyltransferase
MGHSLGLPHTNLPRPSLMNATPSSLVHPTATVDPQARLHEGVRVGPYAYIGPDVEIGAGSQIGPRAIIQGPTRIGRDNRIHANACLGDAPQDLGYKDEPTTLEIGDNNVIREFVTMHRGSGKPGWGRTVVGNGGFFMAYVHIGHDCRIGDKVIMATGAMLAGHVVVEDQVNISGATAVHQFARIGRLAMLGGGGIAVQDIPPFMMAAGNHARLYGLNRRGLTRAGLSAEAITALKHAYRLLYRSNLRQAEAVAALRESPQPAEVEHLLEFLESSQRGTVR